MDTAFDLTALLAAAEQATGLSDWGLPDCRGNFGVLLASLNETGHLNAVGRQALSSRIHATLCNRLKIIDDRKRHAEIAAQRIERPIIVLGMGRTGSTNLLDLLARDPANRVPQLWEVMMPSPPPQRSSYACDPRVSLVQHALDAQGFDDPELQAAHPFSATLPEECGAIYEFMGASGNYCAFANTPRYTHWHAHEANFTAVFQFHRMFLQHLQSHCASTRWALKSPENIWHPEEMIAAYPDALFIHTHRDPGQVLPSLVSLFRSLRCAFAEPDTVDVLQIAREQISHNVLALERTWQARQAAAVRDRIYDIYFSDLVMQPLATIEKLYSHFDLEFSDGARAAMQRYVTTEAKAKHGHGRHHYSMAEFGFTNDMIDTAFRPYMQRYGIAPEQRR
ncbi:MAG: sulfotransferase [Steroidobacteraceae bacterium]